MTPYEEIVAIENEVLSTAANGDPRRALLLRSRALDLARGLDRPRLVAVLFQRLGRTLETQGEIQHAVIAYESGLKALAGDATLELDDVLRSLGAVSKAFHFRDVAVPALYSDTVDRDLAAAEANPALPVSLLIDVGNAYLRQPQEKPAYNAYRQARRRPEIAAQPRLCAYVLANQGEILRRWARTGVAEAVLRRALALFDAHGTPQDKRGALALLAGIAQDRGETENALALYTQAVDLYRQVDDPQGEGRVYAGLGRLHLSQGHTAAAETAFQRALHRAEQSKDEEVLWLIHWGLAQCRRARGDLAEAARSLRRSLDRIAARQQILRTYEGKVTFLDSVQAVFDQLIEIHLDRAEQDEDAYAEALAVAEEARGQALYDLLGRRRRHPPAAPAEFRPSRLRSFPAQATMAAQMAPGFAAPGEPPPWAQMALGAQAQPDSLREESDPSPLQAAPGAWLDEPQAGAAPAEPAPVEAQPEPPPLARLVYHVLPERTAIFAVTPAGAVRGCAVPWGRDALAGQIASLRRMLKVDEDLRGVEVERRFGVAPDPAASTGDYRSLLRTLYTALVAPLADVLPVDGTPVVVEPHGPLWLLPFAALLGPDDTWLADRWPLLHAPSAQIMDQIRAEPDYGGPADLKALIVGNPQMPPAPDHPDLAITLAPLPGAEAEAGFIAELFPGERHLLLIGPAADLDTVAAQAEQVGILHLATHGIAYAGDPLGSFLALAGSPGRDALLTARQVLSLTVPADLVTLSACQTGLGLISGDGVIGLSGAFLASGARAVLVSGWSVSDRATARLMQAFYRAYIAVDNKALALQQAMQAVRGQPGLDHPRYWAAFAVIGAEA